MAVTHNETRRGAYYDSVVLMQLQRALAGLPGVLDAGVVMATPANCQLLAQSDLLPAGHAAGPDDLLIVVKAASDQAATAALSQVDALLARRRAAADQEFRPRSLEAAFKLLPAAGWVLVSVPGRYAAAVARDALRLGRNVFLYSDNVLLADEIELKQVARQNGLLLMGPDCGTAVVGGAGLGFANRLRPGQVGLVAASGAGLQAVSSAIHNLGGGVSQALGTGGRDLSAEVGAITTLQSLSLLGDDPQTRVVVLISKPPAPQVATRLLAAAQAIGKPAVVYFIGQPIPARRIGRLHFATGLADAATIAVHLANASDTQSEIQSPESKIGPGYLRGLFSGGTLAYEAVLGFQATLAPLYTNVPLHEYQRLPDPLRSQAHTILDLGADDFTVGRLHPMMDYDLRLRRLRREAADPAVAVILLDVVLGEGAHPDPAAELAPAIAAISARGRPAIAAIVVGTDADPQDTAAQSAALAAAGAIIFYDTTAAVAALSPALMAAPERADAPAVPLSAVQPPLSAVNVGLESFYDSLVGQGAAAVHVEWRPPAGGDEKLAALLNRLKQAR